MYDVLKWVTMVVLPAIGALYFTLGDIPYAEQVCGTITAVVTLPGVVLGVSSAQYKKKDA